MKSSDKFNPPNVPGYYDLANGVYHESEGLSSSGLKLFMRSPAHYYARYLDPQREPQKDTPSLVLGTQIHTAVLEPVRYFETYYPLPAKYNKATKVGKEEFAYHESKAKAEKKEIIEAESHLICQRIAESIHISDAASYFFDSPGMIEQSFYWVEIVRDPESGEDIPVLCKCRPDKLLDDVPVIVDLKSTTDASYGSFQRDIMTYGYHVSAEWYRRGVTAVLGEEISTFIFAAFEKTAPFAVGFYEADADMLRYAAREIDNALISFARCQKSGEWPGYPDMVVPISLPAWVKTE